MKWIVALIMIFAFPALAHDKDHDKDIVIYQESELLLWCESEAKARYIARGLAPYQWTASYHNRSNVLYVNGRLRVHGDNVNVRCRIARGAREQYATIEIDDPALQAASGI